MITEQPDQINRNNNFSPTRGMLEELGENEIIESKTVATTEDKIICLIKTNEPHLRRAVEKRSKYWTENKGKGVSTIYDIKFEFQDKEADYSNLKGIQMFNHF